MTTKPTAASTARTGLGILSRKSIVCEDIVLVRDERRKEIVEVAEPCWQELHRCDITKVKDHVLSTNFYT